MVIKISAKRNSLMAHENNLYDFFFILLEENKYFHVVA